MQPDVLAGLKKFLDSKNVKYEDKRNEGGEFWIKGGGELAKVISEAKAKFDFKFKLNESENRWLFSGVKKVPDKAIIEFLQSQNIQYIDNRAKNCGLWAIGNKSLEGILKKVDERFGTKFTYVISGAQATNRKSAWWTR